MGVEKGGVGRTEIFVRKINVRFNQGKEVPNTLPDGFEPMGDGAVALMLGKGDRCFRFCTDDIDDRFGLKEIDPAIEERTPGKLPRFGQTGPAAKDRLQQLLHDDRPSVTVNFRNIFTGKTARRAHDDDQNLIEQQT
jgi:hypothetical protein